MQRIYLNLNDFRSKEELLLCLYEQISCPEFCGINFNALSDVLEDVAEDVEFIVSPSEPPEPRWATIFLKVLKQCSQDNEHISYRITRNSLNI